MKLYVWGEHGSNTDFLADWTSGIGVAVAESIPEARQLIRDRVKADGIYSEQDVNRYLKQQPKVYKLPAATYCGGGA